jgi:hypothetical protein
MQHNLIRGWGTERERCFNPDDFVGFFFQFKYLNHVPISVIHLCRHGLEVLYAVNL